MTWIARVLSERRDVPTTTTTLLGVALAVRVVVAGLASPASAPALPAGSDVGSAAAASPATLGLNAAGSPGLRAGGDLAYIYDSPSVRALGDSAGGFSGPRSRRPCRKSDRRGCRRHHRDLRQP